MQTFVTHNNLFVFSICVFWCVFLTKHVQCTCTTTSFNSTISKTVWLKLKICVLFSIFYFHVDRGHNIRLFCNGDYELLTKLYGSHGANGNLYCSNGNITFQRNIIQTKILFVYLSFSPIFLKHGTVVYTAWPARKWCKRPKRKGVQAPSGHCSRFGNTTSALLKMSADATAQRMFPSALLTIPHWILRLTM